MQTTFFIVVALLSSCMAGDLLEEVEKAGATTYLDLMRSVGLDAQLRSGYYTVFAPTNAAFQALPEEVLSVVQTNVTVRRRILQYHYVTGIFRLQDAFNNLLLMSQSNHVIRINVYTHGDNRVVTAEGRQLRMPDIVATNGYLHLVDRVMLPPTGDLYNLVSASSDLSTFKTLLDQAGLQAELTRNPGTVLAPTNEAFVSLEASMGRPFIDRLLGNAVVLKEVLQYHMLYDIVFSPGVVDNSTYITKDIATKLQVSVNEDVGHVNNAKVLIADVPATNGVMHVIDRVLIPPKYATGNIVGK